MDSIGPLRRFLLRNGQHRTAAAIFTSEWTASDRCVDFYFGMDSIGPLPRSKSFLENLPHVHARHMEYETYGEICLQWGGI